MRIIRASVLARNIVSEAFSSLRGRRLQVSLSSFGIATGIAAVVLLVAIVSGMHRYAVEQFSAVGGDIIRVTVNPERSTRDPRGFTVTMRTTDLDAAYAIPFDGPIHPRDRVDDWRAIDRRRRGVSPTP